MRRGAVRCMKLTKAGGPAAAAPTKPKMKPLPHTMKPVDLPSDFTSFPLPAYDESLEFGPSRVPNIPEVQQAELKLQQEKAAYAKKQQAFMEMEDEQEMPVSEGTLVGREGSDAVRDERNHQQRAVPQLRPDRPRYVKMRAPTDQIDRIECTKTPQELIAAFHPKQQPHERQASLCDVISNLRWVMEGAEKDQDPLAFTTEEMLGLLNQLSKCIDIRNPLRLVSNAVHTKGLHFEATDDIQLEAWCDLVARFEEVVVEEHPLLLAKYPKLLAQIAMLMGQMRIFDKHEWFRYYKGQSGHGRLVPNPRFGGGMALTHDHGYNFLHHALYLLDNAVEYGIMENASMEEAVEILAAFSALMTGEVPGEVTRAVMAKFNDERAKLIEANKQADKEQAANLAEANARFHTAAQRLWFANSMSQISSEEVEQVCLSPHSALAIASTDSTMALDTNGLTALTRATYLNDTTKVRAVKEALVHAVSQMAAEGSSDAVAVAGEEVKTVEEERVLTKKQGAFSSTVFAAAEVISSIGDNATAIEVATELKMNDLLRSCVGAMSTSDVPQGIEPRATEELEQKRCDELFNTSYKTKLEHIKTFDTAYIVHSSGIANKATLLALMKKLNTGRDLVIVPQSAMLGLQILARTAFKRGTRGVAHNALQVLTFELYNSPKSCLFIPFTDELLLKNYDKAAPLYEESSAVWNLVYALRADAPLVKVMTVFSQGDEGRMPHMYLKSQVGLQDMEIGNLQAYQQGTHNVSTSFRRPIEAVTVKNFRTTGRSSGRVRDPLPRVGYHSGQNRKRAGLFKHSDNETEKIKIDARGERPLHAKGSNVSFKDLGLYTPDFPQVESW